VAQIGSKRTLLSNGKFQGDNAEEIITQTRFALIPALFTQRFDRALVIGLGTGNTLRTVAHLPFRRVDAVELAPQIVEAARQWFSDVNDRVFDRDPRVRLSIGDGRNFLLLSRERYDMITIEVTSLWVSGEADLYNREFYELCRSHLSEHGVLQQWVALHHLRTRDLLVILNTAAQVFPHIAFFQGANPGHGLLIASSSPLQADYARIAAFDEDAKIDQDLQLMDLPSMWSLLGELVLYDHSYQQAISSFPAITGLPKDFSSSDLRPYLEYQVPKGITLRYDTVTPNSEFLQRFRTASFPAELAITNLPSENERNLIFGYIAERRGDFTQALSRFRTVGGPGANRAQRELLRVHDALPSSIPGTD
jgi:spermidine synthase